MSLAKKERERERERESSVAAWCHHTTTTTTITVIIVSAANFTDSCLLKSRISYYGLDHPLWGLGAKCFNMKGK